METYSVGIPYTYIQYKILPCQFNDNGTSISIPWITIFQFTMFNSAGKTVAALRFWAPAENF